ncbi:MAG: DUF4013 domain-containing protein [bacterium]|nr:DUF4013 domain-containing protein [bacterium]
MTEFAKAFKRPFSNFGKLTLLSIIIMIAVAIPYALDAVPESDVASLLLLSVLVLTAIIFVSFFSSGYLVRCARTASQGDFKLPDFSNLGDLISKGFGQFCISIVYFLPTFALMALLGLMFWIGGIIATITGLVLIFAIIIVMLFTTYFLPMAVVSFAAQNRLGAGFEFKKVINRAFTVKYFLGFLVVLAASFVLGMATAGLSIVSEVTKYGSMIELFYVITAVYVVVSAIISAIVNIFAMTIYGNVYSEIVPAPVQRIAKPAKPRAKTTRKTRKPAKRK